MASWQGLMTVVGALGTFLVAALTLVLSLTRTKSKVEQAEAVVSMLMLFLIFLAMGAPFRWAFPVVLGINAFVVSLFFMFKPRLSRIDFVILAAIWPLFFSSLSLLR